MSKLWQQPFVNVFKHFDVLNLKRASKEGDVLITMDKTLRSSVFKIVGSIPASNYLQVPKTVSQSLGLTGRYVYILFRPVPAKYFVVHMDVATEDGLIIRMSFSNLFKEFKSTSTWLQFPFIVRPAQGSIDEVTLVGLSSVQQKQATAAPSSTRWTILLLDMSYILSAYLNCKYAYLKSIRLCANMYVKGLFTSDTEYEPGLSFSTSRRKTAISGVEPLPRDMAFPVSKGRDWYDVYDCIKFPIDLHKTKADWQSPMPKHAKEESLGVIKSMRQKGKVKESTRSALRLTTPIKTKIRDVPSELPKAGLAEGPIGAFPGDNGEVHVYAYPKQEIVIHEHDKKTGKVQSKVITAPKIDDSKFRRLKPDPILNLKRIIGFGGSTNEVLWTCDGLYIVYSCNAVVIAMEVNSGDQKFFLGHTDKVSSLSFNGNSTLLASSQTGQLPVIRIWDFYRGDCIAMFKSHVHSVFSLSFSFAGDYLCGVGKDSHGKQLIIIWNTSEAQKSGEVSVIAKAHTDVDICKMKISAFDSTRLVSCGRENIRFWRVRGQNLRSCPVNLKQYHNEEFTDIIFEEEFNMSRDISDRRLFASTTSGRVYEIHYGRISIDRVHTLIPVGQKSNCTPSAINAIRLGSSFFALGTDDGHLRLWTFNFETILLEAEHEGSIGAIDITKDGSRILIATKAGNMGYLEYSSHKYITLMRSHLDQVIAASIDSHRRHLVTASRDDTIRIWDLDSYTELFDFKAPGESPCAVGYHPTQQCFACGFTNGSVRSFHVGTASLLAEHSKNHRGRIIGLTFSPGGRFMYSAGSLGAIALYDATSQTYDLIRLLPYTIARGDIYGPNAITVSSDGKCIAFVGPTEFTITIMDARSLDEKMKIDISSAMVAATGSELIDRAIRVSFAPAKTSQLIVITNALRLLRFNSNNGQLISEVRNVHREDCTSLEVSRDSKYLATAGDKVIKIWDYHMRLDLNYQLFIGHSSRINQVLFTPDMDSLVSIGDGIFVWDFYGYVSRTTEGKESGSMVFPDRSILVNSPKNETVLDEYVEYKPRSTIPLPTPSLSIPATLQDQSGDETEFSISQFETDEKTDSILKNDVQSTEELGDKSITQEIKDEALKEENVIPKSVDSAMPDVERSESNENKPILIPTSHQMPIVSRHYTRRNKNSILATRRYAAPPNQAGLILHSVVGYGGYGRNNMVWHPDNGFFAYTNGCLVVIEDLQTGKQTHFKGHTEDISTLALQHDCQILASASTDMEDKGQICLWNTKTGVCNKTLKYHEGDINCLAYSRDDRFLISVGNYRDCAIVVWGTNDYAILAATQTIEPIHDLCWDPYTVNEFATVGANGSLLFWLLDETSYTISLNMHNAEVPEELSSKRHVSDKLEFTCLRYAGDSILYVATNTGIVSAWDTRNNSCFAHWEADTKEIDVMICRGSRMVTGSCGNNLRLWSTIGIGEMRLPRGSVSIRSEGLTMEDEMPLDGSIVSASFDESVDTGIVGTITGTLWYVNWPERTSIRLVSGHINQVNNVVFSGPDDKYFGTCSADGSLKIWTTDKVEQTLQFQVLGQSCNCLAFSPAPKVLDTISYTSSHTDPKSTVVIKNVGVDAVNYPTHCVAGYGDGTVRLFDIEKVHMVMKMQPHATAVNAITYAADGRVILSGGADGLIAINSPSTGLTLRVLSDHKGAPIQGFSVAVIKDENRHISFPLLWLAISADRRISIWSADWSKDFCELIDWLTFAAPDFLPDGTHIAKEQQIADEQVPPSLACFSKSDPDIIVYTGYSMQKELVFYSLSQQKIVRQCPLTHWMTCLDVSPKGNLIVMGCKDRLVQLMDFYEGNFQDFVGHSDRVKAVQFSPSGKYLVTVGYSDVLVWTVVA